MTTQDSSEPIVLHGDGGVEIAVTLIEAIDGIEAADDTTPPPARTRLVGARLRLENTGSVRFSENIRYGTLLLDTEDQQYEPSYVPTAAPSIGELRLEPGDRRVGVIAFELPDDQEPAAVQLILDGGNGPDRALWKLD